MSVVDDYLASLDGPNQRELTRVCSIVRHLVPDAEEAMSYGVPAFKYNDKLLLGLAAHKTFLSIYPASNAIETLKDNLKNFELSKGAIRFTSYNPIPADLLKRLVEIRLKDLEN